MADRRKHFYHFELDILRFWAFFMVFLSHALPISVEIYSRSAATRPFAGLLAAIAKSGAYGVDLFFALSAYLITELLLREYRDRGTISVKDFYARRILRIWPLYLFALLCIRPVLRWINPENEYIVGWYLAGFLLFSGNWVCAFRGMPLHSDLGPLWSVSIEEQFYLTWPLVVKYGERYLAWIAGGLLAIACATRWYLVAHNAGIARIWCDTFARLDPIAGGILLAVMLRGRTIQLSKAVRVLFAAGGWALIVFVGGADARTGQGALWSYPLVAVGCVMMITGVLAPSEVAGQHNRVTQFFIYLGRISYGLYVYHRMAISYVEIPTSSWAFRIAGILGAMLVTVIVAALSFRFLESPFLRLKNRFSYVLSAPETGAPGSVSN